MVFFFPSLPLLFVFVVSGSWLYYVTTADNYGKNISVSYLDKTRGFTHSGT